ncbi:LacI family transcriptional regulator [Streptomyces phaeochromogenes]|uniref:LacI family transcriptional regulator n=1 Tax=Streptomyces phaeochromogenes TaxID=1923 RepID=A0ABZ1H4U5_STRPH|nr:LacI family DNA-binding transcriptional regulator [Streptomyces phaeochromogenes]MCX5599861.1 LacI family transcriptional regulator [Streptomyces phaeochromogenes]WSD13175.1 LacI family transcriptional regulator [Streptomyces phaeochromogenes]WSJ10029.1 LacI family transcriptional regulator [Streptomyces phaeochromogenes]
MAAASGVSRATVSFVLNDDPHQTISAATRDRVKEAARTLGYVPHGIARALREGTSRVVVLNIEAGLESHYSRSYIDGLDAELAAHGYVLLVRHGYHTAQATQQVLDAIAPRAVIRFGETYLTGRELNDLGGGWRDGLAAHAALQLRHLVDNGHTRIALALSDRESPLAATRMKFTGLAASDLSIPRPDSVVIPTERSACAEAVAEYLTREPEVTAIAGFNDDVALRVLMALQDLGRRVPDDVAVIGFDDNGYGKYSNPALTTVYVDAEAHGRLSARLALDLGVGSLRPPPARVVVRQSA